MRIVVMHLSLLVTLRVGLSLRRFAGPKHYKTDTLKTHIWWWGNTCCVNEALRCCTLLSKLSRSSRSVPISFCSTRCATLCCAVLCMPAPCMSPVITPASEHTDADAATCDEITRVSAGVLEWLQVLSGREMWAVEGDGGCACMGCIHGLVQGRGEPLSAS